MKARPIIFSAESVRAILAGTKTQTRRVITYGAAYGDQDTLTEIDRSSHGRLVINENAPVMCPYGRVGERLWVRETWAPHDEGVLGGRDRGHVYYRADDETRYDTDGAWRSPILMPHWASRITLEVTEVRAQRLHEISDEDALAEGITGPHHVGYPAYRLPGDSKPRYSSAVAAFEYGWDHINGKRAPWSSNPWVWAVTFRRCA